MKNPNSKRKLRTVLVAAIFGALLFDVIGFISGIMHRHTEPGQFWNDFSGIMALIIFIPTMLINLGLGNALENLNAYVANALSGAIAFAFFASTWQFIVKRERGNKN
jgi:hypothetical protein